MRLKEGPGQALLPRRPYNGNEGVIEEVGLARTMFRRSAFSTIMWMGDSGLLRTDTRFCAKSHLGDERIGER